MTKIDKDRYRCTVVRRSRDRTHDVNVSLTPELEALVNERVQSGRYRSASEVVREALRLLADHDELRQAHLQDVRTKVAAGIEQLDAGEGLDGNEFFDALLTRLEARATRRT